MEKKAIFIAATGQNVGKTTLCLGLIAILKKKFKNLGFIKPVGQEHIEVKKGLLVDKDVVLFKEHFHLPAHYQDMSPVIVPRGFTRDFLDGKISSEILKKKITTSFSEIYSNNEFTIVEGTGHVGVGSIIDLNNVTVAKELGLDIVIIVKGGLGSAFDELSLNKALCDAMGVKIKGIILNKIQANKREMIISYFTKALLKWQIPLLGALPYDPLLSTPTMNDFATLFNTTLIAGEEFGGLHFETIRLVATSVETFLEFTHPKQLIVTPATREDIIFTLIRKKMAHHGLILTGQREPSKFVMKEIINANIPTLYAPFPTYEAMCIITSYTAKIRKEDQEKVLHAINLVENNIRFNDIL